MDETIIAKAHRECESMVAVVTNLLGELAHYVESRRHRGKVALELITRARERFDSAMALPMVTEALDADADLAERCADMGATIDAAECFARPSGSTRARGDATAGGQPLGGGPIDRAYCLLRCQ